MPTSLTTTRHTTLSSLPVAQSQAIRLRAVLKRALQEAMAVGLGVGIGVSAFACGNDSLEPPDVRNGGVSGKGGAGGQGGQAAGGQGGQGAGGQGGQDQPKPLSICEAAAPGLGCDPQRMVPDFAHFNPPQNVSYWAIGEGSTIKLEHGRSCATSPEPEACQKEVQEAIGRFVRPAVRPCMDFKCDLGETFMLAKGEKGITVIKTPEAMAQFLAPIDTVAEGAAVAQYFSSSVLQCNDKRSGVWCEGDSFTIVAFESSCGLDDVWVKVKVPHSGAAPTREELQRTRNLCNIGRLPDGCESERPAQSSWLTLADFWSECAGLEAASVPAFHMLAEDLRRLDAPAHLISEAVGSADDEIVHTALILGLARQAGAQQSQEVSVPTRLPKSLFAMAHENAVEGCVRETFGAFVAAYQAQNVSNPQTKAILTRIAEDEMRHATLSHAIAAWAEPQLSETARAQIANDRRQLINDLRQSTAAQHALEIYQEAGYPQAVAALRMLDVLQDTTWN